MVLFRVVLVEPEHDGNIGAVARSMGNFAFDDLCMVNPCPIGEEAFKRAKHAGYVLEKATIVDTLDEAVEGCSLVIGTSGVITYGPKNYTRIPLSARELALRTVDNDGRIALVFGREGIGLTQEELARCDILVHIPSDDGYPTLNLSHAVTIVLYEIYQAGGHKNPKPIAASEEERELLYKFFHDLLVAIDYPDFRRENTEVMFRRMMGRSVPTKYEFYTIMGVIGDAAKLIDGRKKLPEKK
ncbi:MAG: RNA methyltransferase [Candidatus Saccharibacteria bacterium]